MAVAGCGTHQARIVDRSGATIAEADVLAEVEWTRELDEFSSARVLITPSGDCCNRLQRVEPWRHELHIFRDGAPLRLKHRAVPYRRAGQIEIFAADILAWLDRRVPHQSMTFDDTDLTDIARWLITDGFEPDDPGHEVYVVGPAGATGGRAYARSIGQTGDHLRDLAETGLDYTAVGSTIILLPEDYTGSVGRLSDADFPEDLVVGQDGSSLTTRWIVAGDEDSGVMAEEGGVDPYYGLLERYVEQTSIKTQASAVSAARSKLRASARMPVFIDTDQVTISPDAAVDVAKLVPGWCLDITTTATCRTVAQRMKITGLKVFEDGGTDSSPGGESVQVQLAATGAEAG